MATADDDKWTLLRATHEGSTLLIRAREFVDGVDRAAYPIRLSVFWEMAEPDENGLASPTEVVPMETFEDRLVEAVDLDGQSLLSAVITGKGQRQWVFHTADTGEFLRRLTDMPQEEDRYPIEIEAEEDPDWEYFEAVTATA